MHISTVGTCILAARTVITGSIDSKKVSRKDLVAALERITETTDNLLAAYQRLQSTNESFIGRSRSDNIAASEAEREASELIALVAVQKRMIIAAISG